MSLVTEIGAAYRGPRRQMRHQIARMTEARTLMLGLTAMFLSFIAALPDLAAQTALANESNDVLYGRVGALFIWRVFFALLLFYAIAALSHLVLKQFKGKGTWPQARLAIMWALMVATPLVLIRGMCEVFAPDQVISVANTITGVVFFWQWVTCLSVVEFPRGTDT